MKSIQTIFRTACIFMALSLFSTAFGQEIPDRLDHIKYLSLLQERQAELADATQTHRIALNKLQASQKKLADLKNLKQQRESELAAQRLIIQKAKKSIEDSNTSINSSKRKIAELRNTIVQLNRDLDATVAPLAEINQKIVDQSAVVEAARVVFVNANEELAEANRRLTQTENSRAAILANIATLERQINSLQNNISFSESEIVRLQELRVTIRNRIDNFESLNAQLISLNQDDSQSLNILRGNLAQVQREIDSNNAEIQSQRNTVNDLEQRKIAANRLATRYRSVLNALQQQLNRNQQEIRNTKQEIKNLDQSVASSRSNLRSWEAVKVEQETFIANAGTRLDRVSDSIAVSVAAIKALDVDLDKNDREKAKQVNQRSVVVNEINAQVRKVTANQREIQTVTQKIAKAKKDKEAAETAEDEPEIKRLKRLLVQLNKSKSDLKEIEQELAGGLRVLNQEKGELDSDIAALEVIAKRLTKEKRQENTKLTQLRDRKQTIRNNLRNTRAQLTQTLTNIRNEEINIRDAENDRDRAESELRDLNSDESTINSDIVGANLDLNGARSDEQRYTNEFNQANRLLSDLQSQNASLHDEFASIDADRVDVESRIDFRNREISSNLEAISTNQDEYRSILSVEIPQLESAISRYRSDITGVQANIRGLKTELRQVERTLAEDLATRNEKLAIANEARSVWRSESQVLRSFEMDRANLLTYIRRLNDQIDAAKKFIIDNETNIANQMANISQKQAEIAAAEQMVATLKAQIAQLTSNIAAEKLEVARLATIEANKLELKNAALDAKNLANGEYRKRLNQYNTEKAAAVILAKADSKQKATNDSTTKANQDAPGLGEKSGLNDGFFAGERDGMARDHKTGTEAGRESGQMVGTKEGTIAGEIKGAEDGLAAGKVKGQKDGQRKGSAEGYKQGFDQGYLVGDNEENYQAGREVGEPLGAEEARRIAQNEDYPKGFEDAKSALYDTTEEAETVDEVDVSGTATPSRRLAANSRKSQSGPMGAFAQRDSQPTFSARRSRQVAHCQNETPGTIAVPNPNTNHTYDRVFDLEEFTLLYKSNYDSHYLVIFDTNYRNVFTGTYKDSYVPACATKYASTLALEYPVSYQDGFDEGYAAVYQSFYNTAFRKASAPSAEPYLTAFDKGYKSTYQGAYEVAFEAGLIEGNRKGEIAGTTAAKQRGQNEGYAETLETNLPAERIAAYDRGYADFSESIEGSTLPRLIGVQVTDETDDGVFTAGEKASIQLTMRNFGGTSAASGKLKVKIRATGNVAHLNRQTVALVELPANTQRTFTGVADAQIFASSSTVFGFVVEVYYQNEKIGEKVFKATVKNLLKIKGASGMHSLPFSNRYPTQDYNHGVLSVTSVDDVTFGNTSFDMKSSSDPGFFATDRAKKAPVTIGNMRAGQTKNVNYYIFHSGFKSAGTKTMVYTVKRNGHLVQKLSANLRLTGTVNPDGR